MPTVVEPVSKHGSGVSNEFRPGESKSGGRASIWSASKLALTSCETRSAGEKAYSATVHMHMFSTPPCVTFMAPEFQSSSSDD